MKKLVITTAVGMILLSSCKKDWTCACTLNGTPVTSEIIKDKTKKDAESACTANNGSAYGYTFSCELQ